MLDNPAGTAGLVVNRAELQLHGAAGADDGQRFFTDAFAPLAQNDPARRVIWHEAEAAGTLNLAAMSAGAQIDLQAGTGRLDGVDVTLASAFATVIGAAGADRLHGGPAAETLRGSEGADTLEGRAGADRLEGGRGFDLASYAGSGAGVNLSLRTGFRAGGDAAGDAWISVEGFEGSAHADTLNGDHAANRLTGGAGDDILRGRGGADTLEGGAGIDIASYSDSPAGVNVSLLTGYAARGHAVGDVWISVEGFEGSRFSDTLNGGAGDDRLDGGRGNDLLRGNGGADVFVFRAGFGTDTIADFLSGTDRLDFRDHAGVGSLADLTLGQDGAHAVIADAWGNRVTVLWAAGQIDAADFLI